MKTGWIKDFEGNFWHGSLMNKMFQVNAFNKLATLIGYDEPLVCVVEDRRENPKGALFYHTAGRNKSKEYHYDLYKNKNFIVKFEEHIKKLEKLHNKYTPCILNNKYPTIEEISEILGLGGALHFATQPHCIEKLEEELKNIAEKKLGGKQELLLDVLKPAQKTTLVKERLAWLNLIIKKSTGEKIDKDLEEYRNKFAHLEAVKRSVAKKEVILSSIEEIGERLNEDSIKIKVEDAKREIENIHKDHKESLEKKKKILEEFKLTEEDRRLINIHSKLSHYRLEGRLMWVVYFIIVCNLRFNLAKNQGLDYKDIDCMSKEEFRDALITGKIVNRDRKNIYLYLKEGSKNYHYYDDEALEKIKLFNIPFEIPKTDRLEGEVSYPGRVEGKARVILWDKHFEKSMEDMANGEILIVDQTKPDLMVALRKAKGIVTNEGGLISHAAIVSREMKIPCIIHTEYATKIFKTGDNIVLDANTGVVYKK